MERPPPLVPGAASRSCRSPWEPSVCAYTRECKVSIGESKAMVPATMTARLGRIFFPPRPRRGFPASKPRFVDVTDRRRRVSAGCFSIAFCAAFILSEIEVEHVLLRQRDLELELAARNDSTMDFTRSAP